MTEKERLEEGRLCLASQGIKLDNQGFYLLEKELINYFVKNEKRILKLQSDYEERGKALDVVTATEYALQEDIFSPDAHLKAGLHNLINVLQYSLAVKKAREISQEELPSDQLVWAEMGKISQTFRPRYMKYMGLVNFVLEHYAQRFQKKFIEISDRAA